MINPSHYFTVDDNKSPEPPPCPSTPLTLGAWPCAASRPLPLASQRTKLAAAKAAHTASATACDSALPLLHSTLISTLTWLPSLEHFASEQMLPPPPAGVFEAKEAALVTSSSTQWPRRNKPTALRALLGLAPAGTGTLTLLEPHWPAFLANRAAKPSASTLLGTHPEHSVARTRWSLALCSSPARPSTATRAPQGRKAAAVDTRGERVEAGTAIKASPPSLSREHTEVIDAPGATAMPAAEDRPTSTEQREPLPLLTLKPMERVVGPLATTE